MLGLNHSRKCSDGVKQFCNSYVAQASGPETSGTSFVVRYIVYIEYIFFVRYNLMGGFGDYMLTRFYLGRIMAK